MITPVKRTALYEEVAKRIIDYVSAGEFKPGDQLPKEIELASRFDVSRNCVREALKALGHAGILYSHPGRGTFVTAEALAIIQNSLLLRIISSGTNMYELLEARMMIEPQLAGLAARHADHIDKATLELVFTKLERRLRECARLGVECNPSEEGMDFHMALADISKNRILAQFLKSVRTELESQTSLIRFTSAEDAEAMIAGHKVIFDAIISNDSHVASLAMQNHLQETFEHLLSQRRLDDNGLATRQ